MNQSKKYYNINLKQKRYGDKYFIRVTDEAKWKNRESFSKYGNTLLITPSYDTDSVNNLTTGQSYTYGGEQGQKINDINEFPLTKTERKNLENLIEQGQL